MCLKCVISHNHLLAPADPSSKMNQHEIICDTSNPWFSENLHLAQSNKKLLFIEEYSIANESNSINCEIMEALCEPDWYQENQPKLIDIQNGTTEYRILKLKCFKSCSVYFTKKNGLDLHMKAVHDLHAYQCAFYECEKSFDDIRNLKTHLETDHKTDEFFCNDCHRHFKDYNKLSSHRESFHHEGVFICASTICGRYFPTRNGAIAHFQDTHQGAYTCKWVGCTETFNSYLVKKRHLKRHSSLRSALCGKCAKRFTNQVQLKEHDRTVHSGKQPYSCTWHGCGVQAVTLSSAIYHVRTVHLANSLFASCLGLLNPLQYLNVNAELL